MDDTEAGRCEVGRRLGHDLFRYGRNRSAGGAADSIREGLTAARARGVVARVPDRFEAKWLQLRVNAYRRGRFVEASVTPRLIRRIDVAECPVIRQPLTHGARSPMDWSIDRLNNDGAYAPGNLAVMSTKANQAKSDRSFDEVLALSRRVVDTDGLTPPQWLRLAALMLGPSFATHSRAAPVIPLVVPLPSHTALPAVQLVQYVFTRGARLAVGRNQLVRHFGTRRGDAAYMKLDRFVQALHEGLKQASPCWDVWLRADVMSAFVAWRNALDGRAWARVGEVARQVAGGHRVERETVLAWHLELRGLEH